MVSRTSAFFAFWVVVSGAYLVLTIASLGATTLRGTPLKDVAPFSQLEETCPFTEYAAASFDPFNKYVPLSDEALHHARSRNPFKCGSQGTLDEDQRKLTVASWYYSKSREKYIFGGFTADMGWPLMIARYLLTKRHRSEHALQFLDKWGHGCNTDSDGWTCFFQQITPSECLPQGTPVDSLTNKATETRHKVKLYDIYNATKSINDIRGRNRNILELAELDDVLQPDNDLQTMQIVFQWVYQLLPQTRLAVDKIKHSLGFRSPVKAYIAFHIRWGDKIGRGGGPVESAFIPLRKYVEAIHCYYLNTDATTFPNHIYVATDDYGAVEELRELLGSNYVVTTSATKVNTGFAIEKYHSGVIDPSTKWNEAVRLWADMEILAGSDLFVGNMESSVGKMVQLMRVQKHPKSSINAMGVHRRSAKSCCAQNSVEALRTNCFWTCT